jgi:acyl carrier protein
LESIVRDILGRSGDLSVPVDRLDASASLFDAGLSSFGTVEVMVALEERLGVPFPDHMLTRETFGSIAALTAAAERLARLSKAA